VRPQISGNDTAVCPLEQNLLGFKAAGRAVNPGERGFDRNGFERIHARPAKA
jgi:hypothetical protein